MTRLNGGRPPWEPPQVQPGDRILSGVITHDDGTEEKVRVLVRIQPDGRTLVTGFDQHLILKLGDRFAVDLDDGDQ